MGSRGGKRMGPLTLDVIKRGLVWPTPLFMKHAIFKFLGRMACYLLESSSLATLQLGRLMCPSTVILLLLVGYSYSHWILAILWSDVGKFKSWDMRRVFQDLSWHVKVYVSSTVYRGINSLLFYVGLCDVYLSNDDGDAPVEEINYEFGNCDVFLDSGWGLANMVSIFFSQFQMALVLFIVINR